MNLNTNYIKEFLDIEDPCLNFISCTRTTYRGKNVIMCVALAELNVCPNCESDNFIYNGFKTVTIPYISANASKPVFIKVKKHGIFCKNCQEYSYPSTNIVEKHCHISNAVKQQNHIRAYRRPFYDQYCQGKQRLGHHCSKMSGRVQRSVYPSFDSLPEHLAFDEFRGVGRKLHFICQDGEKHTIVVILQNRFKSTIRKYFEQFPETTRKAVKTVSTDLNCYYGSLARELFPNAKVVVDRFHMVQMVTRSFTGFRVQVMKEMDKTSREYKLLKSHWKLYLKKYKELEGTHQVYNRSLRAPYTQSQIVSEGLQCDETLENTYNFMQDFMYALKYKDPEKIEELLSGNTRQYCPQLRTTIRSFRRSFRAVLNGATLPFSNGCLEGLNRKIKQIERTAYGYSNFTHLLKRIRLEQNLISLKKSAKRLEAVQHSH